MSIIRLLTKKHLASNKGRTIITIFGIAISVAMITAVFVATASFFNYFGQLALYTDGNSQATFKNISIQQIEDLYKDNRIAQLGIILDHVDSSAFVLEGEGSRRIRIGNLYAGDAINLQQMISCDYDGTLPCTLHEAAVEESFLIRNGLKAEPGQTISIETGHRTWENGDGEIKTYYGNYQEDEMWDGNEYETLKITAILHGNPGTKNYKIVRGLSSGEIKNVSGKLNAMITLKKVNRNSSKLLDQMANQYGVIDYTKNDEYLDSLLCIRKGSTLEALLPMLSIIMIIIIFASVALIYNAFSMSLTERVRYLGMLASLGATRKQKRYSVYYEGFLLGIIGIPLGFLLGVCGIAVTLAIVSKMIVGSDMIPALESNPGLVVLKLSIPPMILPFILIISCITIFIAAYKPAKMASKIMPIDAIRQTQQIRIKNKQIRCPGYISKIFGFEGELAYKNMKRNPGKSRIITVSITVSVVLFLSVTNFCNLFWDANGDSFIIPYDVIASSAYDQGQKLMKEIESIEDVKEVYLANMIIFEYDRNKKDSADLAFIDKENIQKSYRKMFADEMDVDLRLLSDEDFNYLCQKNDLDASKYYGDTIRAALCNTITYNGRGKEVFTEKVFGQKLRYDNKEKFTEAEIEIADFVKWEDNEHLYGMYAKNRVTAFAPLSTYAEVLYHGKYPDGFTMDFAIKTENQALVYSQIQDILDQGGYKNTFCQNISDDTSTMSTVAYILQIFSYGFIALITLITVANIVNSISTGIHQRKKEFAMLKSVGMTQKGFMKMNRLEVLLYGFRALIVGIPLSLIINYVMTKSLANGIPFHVDILSYITVIGVVFGLLALTMIVSISKLKNQSIIDTLKEDIY